MSHVKDIYEVYIIHSFTIKFSNSLQKLRHSREFKICVVNFMVYEFKFNQMFFRFNISIPTIEYFTLAFFKSKQYSILY